MQAVTVHVLSTSMASRIVAIVEELLIMSILIFEGISNYSTILSRFLVRLVAVVCGVSASVITHDR